MGDEVIDLFDQLAQVAEGAAADGALGDEGEPALDLIKPTGIGGGEVQVIAGMTGQPGFDLGVFVGGVIIQDQVGVEVGGKVVVQMLKKGQELLMTMRWLALGNDAAVEDIEGRKERGGAVAQVVVSDTFDVTQNQGQDGLGALERKANITCRPVTPLPPGEWS